MVSITRFAPGFRGDGRTYHKRFSRIGFDAGDADLVSFVELLRVPTYGRSALNHTDLNNDANRAHLNWLGDIFHAR